MASKSSSDACGTWCVVAAPLPPTTPSTLLHTSLSIAATPLHDPSSFPLNEGTAGHVVVSPVPRVVEHHRCAVFEAALLHFCFHEQGADRARRGPSILGRWLKRREGDSKSSAARVEINRPSSVEQSWRLGALHERYFKGAHAGDDSILREAGEVLGVGRALTEVYSEAFPLKYVPYRNPNTPALDTRVYSHAWSPCE